MVGEKAAKNKQNLALAAVLVAVAAYFVLFFATRLPSYEQRMAAGDREVVFRRGDLVGQLLLLPDELLLSAWFGSPPGFALLDRVPVLLAAGAILAVAAAAGWLMMVAFRADRGLTRLETFVFSTVVGLNAVSTYVLAIGLAGALHSVLVYALPAGAVLAGAGYAYLRRRRAGTTLCEAASGVHPSSLIPHPSAERWLDPRWLWLAAPFVAVIVLGAMLPPVDFDVCEYHLQVPKEWFQQGRIGFLPHNVYGNMPMGSEVLSLPAMCLLGDWWLGALAGKTVIASYTLLCGAALVAAGRRFFSPAAGLLAAVVYLSTPWIVRVSTSGLVEGASACTLFLAMYAVMLWRQGSSGHAPRAVRRRAGSAWEKENASVPNDPCPADGTRSVPATFPGPPASRGHLLLAGYLAGAAVSIKYPALLFVALPLAVWIAVGQIRRQMSTNTAPEPRGLSPRISPRTSPSSSPRILARRDRPGGSPPVLSVAQRVLAPLLAFLLAAAVGCGLWLGKNAVLAGNPTYPLLYGVFGGKTWTAGKDARWNRIHRPHDFSPRALGVDLGRGGWLSEWLDPLLVPLALLGRVGWRSEWLSPLLVPLALLAFVDRRKRKLALLLAAFFAYVIAAWWLLTHRIDRFWIPALPLVALLAGWGACWRRDRAWRVALVVVLAAGLGADLLFATGGPGGYNRYFVALDRLRRAPERVGAWHLWFNGNATGGRVLLVGDAQPFDLEVPVLYDTCFDDCIFEELVEGRTPREAAAALAERGVTYVFVDWGEIARYRSPGNYGFTDFVQPEVFRRLVEAGVLEPLPEIEGNPGRGYRVVAPGDSGA